MWEVLFSKKKVYVYIASCTVNCWKWNIYLSVHYLIERYNTAFNVVWLGQYNNLQLKKKTVLYHGW